jgi:Cu(I)/Ag(I) efflux system membrane fusion protein
MRTFRRNNKGEKNMSTPTARALTAAAFLLVAGAAGGSEFDRAMDPILSEYLEIHAALAADETRGVEEAVRAIEPLARKLRPETATAEHAEHYANIPRDILAACDRLEEAKEIGSIRDAFAELSRPLSMWVTMARPKGMSVMYCPMRKAGWVQRGSEVANPYYGAKMSSCGEKVGGGD